MSILSVVDSLIFAFWSPGPAEMLVLAVVALLLYGGNLPEVARSWGKTFSEFRRGLSGFQNEMNEVIYSEPDQITYQDESQRDDSRLVNGYEETDDYVDDADVVDDANVDEPGIASELDDEVDVNEQTAKNASADTVIYDQPQAKPQD